MFLHVDFQRSPGSKRTNARRVWTHQLVHFPVHHQEMVDHLFVGDAVDVTLGTNDFALIQFQMRQQMQSELVRGIVEATRADAARFDGADWLS